MITLRSQTACRPSRGFRAGVYTLPSQRSRPSAPCLPWYTREEWRSLRAYLARPTPDFWLSSARFLDELDEVFVLLD